MNSWIVIYIIFHIACGIFAAGALNASERGEFNETNQNPSTAAHGQGGSLFIGLLWGPLAAIVAIPMSGFLYHGWTLSRKPTSAPLG